MGQNELARIKNSLEDNIGQRVQLTAKKGRKKTIVKTGVIESIHPSIFTVTLEADSSEEYGALRRVSYSYTDVLTKTVELVICEEELAASCV